jgi:indole-3-glycerol phosphate synthase
MDLLSEIIAKKRIRVKAAKALLPLDRMRALAQQKRESAAPHRFLKALSNENRVNIIAEFKRRSPSKGDINIAADPASVGRVYEAGGAAAISVLTEEDSFAGSLDDLRAVRHATSLAILRKDFIFEEFQVYETAAAGADAVLLIVAALDDETLKRLRKLAEDDLGLDALVEVHTEAELMRALRSGAGLLGVNNRDLRTFKISIETSLRLGRLAPADAVMVSESGLTPEEVHKLRAVGYKGFLVGETLMRADDPVAALSSFLTKQA